MMVWLHSKDKLAGGVGPAAGRWLLGKSGRDDPQRIMTEVYRTLRKLGFVIPPFSFAFFCCN
jgi:hypothetical protein